MSEDKDKGGCGGCLLFPLLLLAGAAATYHFTIHDKRTFISGDETSFDAIKEFPYASGLAGSDVKFLRMTAAGVRSNGTLDLTADYRPSVDYVWKSGQPGSDAPIGASAFQLDGRYVRVKATKLGFYPSSQTTRGGQAFDFNLGFLRSEFDFSSAVYGETTTPPVCSLAGLWKIALSRSAPKDAVATITYTENGYHFEILSTDVSMRFNAKCELIE